MNFEIIFDHEEFEALKAEWDDLFSRAVCQSPYLLHEWLAARAKHVERDIAICTLRDGGRLCAALPLALERRVGTRVARHLSGPICSPVDILAGSLGAASALWAAVHRAKPFFDAMWIEGFRSDGLIVAIAGSAMRQVDAEPVLRMPRGWIQAWSENSAGRRLREPGRRQLRRLSAVGEPEFVCARSADALDAAYTEAVRVHAARWQSGPDVSGFATDRSQKFHRDFLHRIQTKDLARILLLKVDNCVIAFDFFFVMGSIMYAYRTAYDPTFRAFSPGLLAVFRSASLGSQSGATAIHWGRGREPYKIRLSNTSHPIYETLEARTPSGRRWLFGRECRRPIDNAISGNPRLYRAYRAAVRVAGKS